MTRIENGIMGDIVFDNGMFLTDKEMDLVLEWLDAYADALEKAWVKKGSEGEPRKQKFAKVRSLRAAVEKQRADWATPIGSTNTRENKE